MCFAKNKLSKPLCGIIVAFLMKYPKSSLVLALCSFVAFSTWLLTRGLCSNNSPTIYPLFHADSPVTDVSNGSAASLQILIQQFSILFVMYYAHWCAQSTKMVYDFHRASKKFDGQVSFVAINCWAGSCRHQNFPQSYPQLFLHHTNYEPLEYRGRHKFVDMVCFLQTSIRPITYISSQNILEQFLDQGKPSLLAFFNGTNYEDKKYKEFFGAALHSINTVSSLQFGVITSSSIALLLNIKKFGQIILINPLKSREAYPQELKYNQSSLTDWVAKKKIEYVKKLDPDRMEAKAFGAMIKSNPSLILFVPINGKDTNKNILYTYHQVTLSYHNCSCSVSEPIPNPPDDSPDETSTSPIEKPHDCPNAHVTSCQSLPVSDIHGMQNSCDVCRECYETCSCAGSSFPLRTSTLSVLRGFALPRNSCRCLRRNSYQEKNSLSVCCFDKETPKLRASVLLNLRKTTGAVSETLETGLNREEHLKILAEKFQKLNKDLESNPSENSLGVFNNLLGNLIKLFNSSATESNKTKLENCSTDSSGDFSRPLEYQEYGTCEQRGKVNVFAGAGCHSNISVNFYYMDSRKHWKYAEAFGVRHDTLPRVALVLVDSENEAQYVLSEEKELNNASIVNFVMNFTHGNLTRRLRSAPVPNQSCSVQSGGCLIEVVSKTFPEIVLDHEKDVLLMYYTAWCGFCKSVKPVMISLVDHYKYSQHIRIARLNADLNDLPWEYTVDAYPSFLFFPAKRKDFSVKFPDHEERSLENLIKFVENHKTSHVKANRKCVTGPSHVRLLSLQRNLNDLKRQNVNLRRRLNREILAKQNAEKRRLTAERQVSELFDEDLRSRFDYQSELEKLSLENTKLLREIINARDELRKYRKIAERTVAELRKRNWELQATIVSLEEDNLLRAKEPSAKNTT